MHVRALFCSLAIFLLVAGFASAKGQEPEFEGRTADWWAEELRYEPEGLSSQRAIVRLARGGAEAVPVLVEILATGEETGSAIQASQILRGIAIHDHSAMSALIEHLSPLLVKHHQSFSACTILEILVVAHSDARQALHTELKRLLAESSEPSRLGDVQGLLVKTTNKDLEGLRGMLEVLLSGDADVSVYSALQDAGKDILPLLIELLPTAKREAFFEVHLLLESMELPADELFSGLLPAIKGPEEEWVDVLRSYLVMKAGEKGVTFEHRRKLFGHLNDDYRLPLIPEMQKDAKSSPGFADFVAEALADEGLSIPVRIGLLDLVRFMKPARAKTVVPHLIAGLKHPEPSVREASARAITAVASAVPQAISLLEKALEGEDDDEVRWVLEKALDQLRKK